MATEEQQTTKVFTEKKENSIFVQKITTLCDIHVTPSPKDALGTGDYYKDDSKKQIQSIQSKCLQAYLAADNATYIFANESSIFQNHYKIYPNKDCDLHFQKKF